MSIAPHVCVLLLMAGLVPAVRADDAQPSAKPAKTAAPSSASSPAGESHGTKPAAVPEADDELLEFLGSVDSETGDQDWLDYLSQTDIAKAAKGK